MIARCIKMCMICRQSRQLCNEAGPWKTWTALRPDSCVILVMVENVTFCFLSDLLPSSLQQDPVTLLSSLCLLMGPHRPLQAALARVQPAFPRAERPSRMLPTVRLASPWSPTARGWPPALPRLASEQHVGRAAQTEDVFPSSDTC